MSTVEKPTARLMRSGLTGKEMVERRRALSLIGKSHMGRPKSALGIKKRALIRTEEDMVKAIKEKSGFIVDNLMINAGDGDTRAGLGLLDRAYGKAKERGEVKHTFDIYGIARGAEHVEAIAVEKGASPSLVEAPRHEGKVIDVSVN